MNMELQNDNYYKAKDGCFIVRKRDNYIMGEYIYLGKEDNINNYEDIQYTDESYDNFYKSIRKKSPKEIRAERESIRQQINKHIKTKKRPE